jgi:hypothetical protein
MSNAELTNFTRTLIVHVTKDLSDFATFGVTEADIEALASAMTAFQDYPTDEAFANAALRARMNRDEARKEVLEKIKHIALRFVLAYKNEESPYNNLDMWELGRQTDDVMLARARKLGEVLPLYEEKLQYYGQTPAVTASYITTVKEFEDAIASFIEATAERSTGAKNRIIAGNDLYDRVSRLTSIGKMLYQAKDKQQYQKYVIYGMPTTKSAPDAPENLIRTTDDTLEWTPVKDATSYTVFAAPKGSTEWEKIATTKTEFFHLPKTLVTAKMQFKVRARNANGYGDFSEVVGQEDGGV